MNHLPYRAIALDLDGTLTNHDKVVTPKTREALLQAEAEGVVIILASGRPTYGIEPVAECLELDKRGGYILSYNGGNIVNAKTGEKLFAQFLPDEVIPILYRYAKEKNHALLGYAGNEIITEMPDDQYVKEESRINKMNIRKVENLFEALEPHPTKLLMTGDPADMLKAENELSEILGDRMDIFRSAPFFLELVPKGIDKAKSLLRLLSKINLTPADMIAFGDGYNDLSMLKLAGMGVAMQNAAPEVRAEADYEHRIAVLPVGLNKDDVVGLLDVRLLDENVLRRGAEAVLRVIELLARRDERIEFLRDQIAKLNLEALFFKELHRGDAEVVGHGFVARVVKNE